MQKMRGEPTGKILEVDLSSGSVAPSPWKEEDRQLYLGGRNLAARLLYDRLTGREKAFSEDCPLIISAGALTGTGIPGSSCFDITTLHPLGCGLISAAGNGFFGARLKQNGLEALVILGKAEHPQWLELCGGTAVLHDLPGSELSLRQAVEAELDKRGCRSKYSLLFPEREGRSNARLICDDRFCGPVGAGAVLLYKNLLAVVLVGNGEIRVADRARLQQANRGYFDILSSHPLTENEEQPPEYPDGISGGNETRGCLGCPLKCVHSQAEDSLGVNAAPIAAPGGLEDILHRGGGRKGLLPPSMKAEFTIFSQNIRQAYSAAGLCLNTSYSLLPPALFNADGSLSRSARRRLLFLYPALWLINRKSKAAAVLLRRLTVQKLFGPSLGCKISAADFIRAGQRGYTMERMINTRFHVPAEQDSLSSLLSTEETESRREQARAAKACRRYRKSRGWDEDGMPTVKTLLDIRIIR